MLLIARAQNHHCSYWRFAGIPSAQPSTINITIMRLGCRFDHILLATMICFSSGVAAGRNMSVFVYNKIYPGPVLLRSVFFYADGS